MVRRRIAMLFLAVAALGLLFLFSRQTSLLKADWSGWLAGLVWPETITPEDLAQRYSAARLRILLVPGHDNDYGGAEYKGVKEAELNLLLARHLFDRLAADPRWEAVSARDFTTGEYLPALADYFRAEEGITAFRRERQEEFAALVQSGELAVQAGPHHNFARPEIVLRLYGINKWANENDFDIVLHLHFNDDPGRRRARPGRYSGLAVYAPERQYPNARASISLADALFNHLQQYFPVSDLPQEAAGVVEDQTLIAVGANASREGASLLIEYGYIYEPQLVNAEVRELLLPEMAFQTYLGLKKHFGSGPWLGQTTLLPAFLDEHLVEGRRGNVSVLILQKMLAAEGFYPPAGQTFSDCPLNGNFGRCTRKAVVSFQTKYDLPPTGYVGVLTIAKLNELYGPR